MITTQQHTSVLIKMLRQFLVVMLNNDGGLLYHVEASCNGLPCPPYVAEKELTCAVCTKPSEPANSFYSRSIFSTLIL